MKTRWNILLAVGIFLLLACASAWVTAHHQPENEVEAYKKLLRAKGEKLEINEVLPSPVPPEQNCVDAVRMAFGLIHSGSGIQINQMQMVAPGKAMVGSMQPEARGWSGSSDFTNSWEVCIAEVAPYRPAIEMLKQVFVQPKLDFQLDYQKGFSVLLPHLAEFKRAAQTLAAATACDLHAGDTGNATTNICTLLALVNANHDEATLISHLVRLADVAIASSMTWELLQATNATDAQLATLQNAWEKLEFLDATENAFLMERAMMKDAVEKARASNTEFDRVFSYTSIGVSPSGSATAWPPDWEQILKDAKYDAARAMWRSSWSYSQETYMLQGDQVVLETLRGMKTNELLLKPACDLMSSNLSSLGLTNKGEAMIRWLDLKDFSEVADSSRVLQSTVSKTIRIEAARRVVIAATALKRFQVKHGKWPDTLGELVPEFISAVPVDPYDGKPLRYQPNPDGNYLLYCVGEDGVDDGGDPTLPTGIISSSLYWQNTHARDWVWPQPATEAEIKYFYEHPPK
jgi:hypothetical protein